MTPDITIYERLSAVETRLGALDTNVTNLGADVRVIRDYVVKEKANRHLLRTMGAVLVAFVTAVTALWHIFAGYLKT